MKLIILLFLAIYSYNSCSTINNKVTDETTNEFYWKIENKDTVLNITIEKYYHNEILFIENEYVNDKMVKTRMLDHLIQQAIGSEVNEVQFDTMNSYFIPDNYLTKDSGKLTFHFWRPFTPTTSFSYLIFIDSQLIDTVHFDKFPAVEYSLTLKKDSVSSFDIQVLKKESNKQDVLYGTRHMFKYSHDGII